MTLVEWIIYVYIAVNIYIKSDLNLDAGLRSLSLGNSSVT